MAYQGWLIKLGGYTFPQTKIYAKSYQVTYNSQDLDSYRDADGYLHRNALEHKCSKVEFETTPMLTDAEMDELMSNIRANYTSAVERKLTATIYIPELGDYLTQEVYMSDPSYKIYGTYHGVIHYESVRLAFIAY